ncbi:MAG: 50S ribosomal protein L35 [Anaerolineae bacterium]|nr:50S ribosomal protein L35 [Anaerolineae bacterium]
MPKLKTHKSTSKRFRRTKGGKGKLMRTRQGKSHLRRKKSKRSRRDFYKMVTVDSRGVTARVRKLIPDIGALSAHKTSESYQKDEQVED